MDDARAIGGDRRRRASNRRPAQAWRVEGSGRGSLMTRCFAERRLDRDPLTGFGPLDGGVDLAVKGRKSAVPDPESHEADECRKKPRRRIIFDAKLRILGERRSSFGHQFRPGHEAGTCARCRSILQGGAGQAAGQGVLDE